MKLDRDGYPTTCCRCHQPIVKKRHDTQHHYDHATSTATSWHTTCKLVAPGESKPPVSTPRPRCTGRGVRGDVDHAHHNHGRSTMNETTTPEPEPQPEPAPDPEPDDGDNE